MADVSDGLLADLGHIAQASGVVAHVQTDSFVVADPLAAVAAAYGTDPHDLGAYRRPRPRLGCYVWQRDNRCLQGFVAVGHIEEHARKLRRRRRTVEGSSTGCWSMGCPLRQTRGIGTSERLKRCDGVGPADLLGDFASLDARRADRQFGWSAVDGCAHGLHVGVPAAGGAAVRVGNAVAESRAFATDITFGGHGNSPRWESGLGIRLGILRWAELLRADTEIGNRGRISDSGGPPQIPG